MPAAKFASRLRAATRRERTQRQGDSFADRLTQSGVEVETVARVEALIEQLTLPGPRITVDTAAFRDAVVVVLRMQGHAGLLDARQEALLQKNTTTWSSAGGKDGRTVCFEMPRP
jgi:hypothetical protein